MNVGAEKECGHCFKVLRPDRGVEYTFNIFVIFNRKNDIWKELTASYALQKNGVSVRNNRTIVEMAKNIMKENGLPTEYWGEVVAKTIYLISRCLQS